MSTITGKMRSLRDKLQEAAAKAKADKDEAEKAAAETNGAKRKRSSNYQ
jgi:hypothetical protein